MAIRGSSAPFCSENLSLPPLVFRCLCLQSLFALIIGRYELFRLKYKIEDVLLFFNDCLEILKTDIHLIAQGLINMRNFFSDYNTGLYVEPSYQELFSANHVLRFVLLAIVYKTIGLR